MSTNSLQHVALVMDGNRRWATSKGMPKLLGHTEGAKRIKPVVQHAIDLGIPYVTLWALSTENLKNRGEKELDHLFSLFKRLVEYIGDFAENNVRFNLIGDIAGMPQDVQDALQGVLDSSADNTGLVLTLAVNYGGRDDILRAIRKMGAEGVDLATLDEEMFSSHLDTAGMPDPDLIVRTGGHQRLSGYLPWQSTYAELYFTDVFWPAFTKEEFQKAIDWFYEVQRNRGK